MSDIYSQLPAPAALHTTALITFQWGEQTFEMVATAASIRQLPWEDTGEPMTWLHCKAFQLHAAKEGAPIQVLTLLIPIQYVTRILPAVKYRLGRSNPAAEPGIFAPVKLVPPERLPVPEIERVLTALRDPSNN